MDQLIVVAVTCVLGGLVVLAMTYLARRLLNNASDVNDDDNVSTSTTSAVKNGTTNVSSKKSAKLGKTVGVDHKHSADFQHEWLASNLKGHSRPILDLDFACNGKFLMTCSDDGGLILWSCKDIAQRDHKTSRGTIDLDHADLIRFGPDSKSLFVHLARADIPAVFRLVKKEGATTYRFERVESVEFTKEHTRDISHIGFACNGHFFMSASSDAKLVVYDIKGSTLHSWETKQSALYHAAVSPCGRFVAASGFTPDVKVFEVCFDRSGNFKEVKSAFQLKGHNSGVYTFDFSQDSTRMLTASKDGTWRFWDTDIRYAQGEEPVPLLSGEWDVLRTAKPSRVRCALTADGCSFAICVALSIRLYEVPVDKKATASDVWHRTISDVYSSCAVDACSALRFSTDGQLLAIAGDKHVRVLHNVAGYRAQLAALQRQRLKPQGDAHLRRIDESIDELNNKLKQMGIRLD